LGSCLALFALACQLVLAFGHVHLDEVSAHSSMLVSVVASGGTEPTPATGDTPDHVDRYCAICALIHLAGALAFTEPASLPLPVAFGRWRPDAALKLGLPTPTPAYFAARAPPVA
jgi:hypothetical protein